jgi:hypothetical protein
MKISVPVIEHGDPAQLIDLKVRPECKFPARPSREMYFVRPWMVLE